MRYILALLCLSINFSVLCQTTYTSSPGLDVYTTCPSSIPNSCPSGTFLGGTVHFKLDQITSSNFIFKAKKCDNTSFGTGGTFYIKENDECGAVLENVYISSGSFNATLYVSIPTDFLTGSIDYYLTFNSDNGDKYWGGYITITADTDCDQPTINSVTPTCEATSYSVEVNFSGGSGVLYDVFASYNGQIYGDTHPDVTQGTYTISGIPLAQPVGVTVENNDFPTVCNDDSEVVECNECEPPNITDVTPTCYSANYSVDVTFTGVSGVVYDVFASYNGQIYGNTYPDVAPGTYTISGIPLGQPVGVTVEHNTFPEDCNDDSAVVECDECSPPVITSVNENCGATNYSVDVTFTGTSGVVYDVFASYDNQVYGNSIANVPAGSYTITDIPLGQPVGITVEHNDFPADCNDDSAVVECDECTSPTITSVTENCGATNYSVDVSFTGTSGILYDVFASYDNQVYGNSIPNVPAGSYTITDIPLGQPVGITVEHNDFPYDCNDDSAVVLCDFCEPPSITNVFPICNNDDYSVNVTFDGVSGIVYDVFASWGGQTYGNTFADVSQGTYTIAGIPFGQPVGITVEHNDFPNDCNDDSEVIESNACDEITVTSPIENQVYNNGLEIPITWTSEGAIDSVEIQLIFPGGSLADEIIKYTDNDGTYNEYVIPVEIESGSYKIRVISKDTNTEGDSEEFEINNQNSYNLKLVNTGIQITPSPSQIGTQTIVLTTVENLNETSFDGSFRFGLIYPSSDTLILQEFGSVEIIQDQVESFTTNFTEQDSSGSFKVFIQYRESNTTDWFDVPQNGFLNPINLSILNPAGDCEILNPPASQIEAFDAVQYLCGFGLIQQPQAPDFDVLPDSPILKEDLAKVVFLSIYDFDANATTPADDFPVPFGDMQQQENQAYARYGKVLSYLQYDDAVSPFSRRFFNYRPGSHLTRGEVAKVFVEAFDLPKEVVSNPFSDVDSNNPYYTQITNLADLGIVSSSQSLFRPNDVATRIEVFIMLHRYLTQCSDCPDINPDEDDFYNPGNYTPFNLGNHPSLSDANFDQYSKSSFYIPGRNLPLVFEHSYNSYFTELPEEFFCVYNDQEEWVSLRPLGNGWTHSYNSYIQYLPGYNVSATLYQPDRYVVFWPNGGMHIYQGDPSNLDLITEGVYDDLAYNSGDDSFIITKKNQIKYFYEKKNTVTEEWPHVLTKIEDRNGNEINLEYENYSGGGLRLKRVFGTSGRTLTFNYNQPNSHISNVTDPLGRTVSFNYGGPLGDDLFQYVDAESYTTTYQYYNETGKEHLLRYINLPNGNFVDNQYEQRKLTSSKTMSNGGSPISSQSVDWSLGASPSAKTSSSVTINDGNQVYQYEYENNELGRVTSLSTPSNQLDQTLYQDNANPTLPTSVTIDGITTTYEYDNKGNVTNISQPLGVEHEFIYNTINDIESYTNPRDFTTSFTYEGPGNLQNIITPIGTSTFEYNSYGQVKKVINPEGLYTNINYDNYGNPDEISTDLGISSSATYDLIGRVKTQTNPNDQVTEYDYDNRDFLKMVTDPMDYITKYDYDGNGNLKEVENAKGNKTTMEYGYFDWLESITFGGLTKEFEYDDEGKLVEVKKPDGTILDYLYDSKGNLIDNDYATFTYDSKNRLKTVTKDNKTLTFYYDDLHRITKTKYDGQSVEYDYDSNSNVEKITYPGGLEVDYSYDSKDRLKTVEDWNGALTTYNYLDDDRLSETIYPNGVITFYTYDDAGRMKSMVTHLNGDTIAGYDFDLDLLGNHLNENKNELLDSFYLAPIESTASYDAKNWIEESNGVSFSHDNNGNMTSQTGRTYGWDDHDMLTSISGDVNAIYKYDGLGNRRESVINGVGKKYILDILGMSQVLIESTTSGTPENYYVYGLGLISRIDPSGETRYYHGDFRGSTVAMTDESGVVTHSYLYDAFGTVLDEEMEDDNIFQFVGMHGVQKDIPDLYFMRARYYNSEQGRFISEDPVWSANLYSYSNNNPTNNFDTDGRSYNPIENFKYNYKTFIKPSLEFLGEGAENLTNFIETEARKSQDILQQQIDEAWSYEEPNMPFIYAAESMYGMLRIAENEKLRDPFIFAVTMSPGTSYSSVQQTGKFLTPIVGKTGSLGLINMGGSGLPVKSLLYVGESYALNELGQKFFKSTTSENNSKHQGGLELLFNILTSGN